MPENMQYVIREAQKDKDAAKIARILSECFGPVTPRQLNQWMAKPGVKLLVCEAKSNVISNIGVEPQELHVGEGVYVRTGAIGGVCTCSEHRRKGIMTDMMRQTLDYVRNSGVSTSSLYTGLMLPAHRIYERSGFCDVQTWPFYVKILDFQYVFRVWLRELNRAIKVSRIAKEILRDWNRTVLFRLEELGVQSIRFSGGHFRRMRKSPKNADVDITISYRTLLQIMWGGLEFEDARKTALIGINRGTEDDLLMLRKILTRIWDE